MKTIEIDRRLCFNYFVINKSVDEERCKAVIEVKDTPALNKRAAAILDSSSHFHRNL